MKNRLPRWVALMKASSLAACYQYIVLHPANRGRSLAKIVKQVTDIERKKAIPSLYGLRHNSSYFSHVRVDINEYFAVTKTGLQKL